MRKICQRFGIAIGLFIWIASAAQAGPPAFGEILGDFRAPGSGNPIGLEHDGNGNLLLTESQSLQVILTDLEGEMIWSFSYRPETDLPIGITIFGNSLFLTDVEPDGSESVDRFTLQGDYLDSFSVSDLTTFPEGITFNPWTGYFYMVGVDDSGIDHVFELTTDGSLVRSFPLATESTDGIAFDPLRCTYWVYDSASDSVTQYNQSFIPMDSFPGPKTYGYFAGEGVAVIGDVVYVVSRMSVRVVMFNVAGARVEDGCGLFTDGFETGDTSRWSVTVP